jgi:hypothetical protein
MKLTKEQIQFIDNFLQRNDVVFVDIRQEMLDHIATAVEDLIENGEINFHDAFVGYVNSNKKELFKMNRSVWWFSFSEIKNYLRFFLKPISLFTNALIIVIYFLFSKNEDLIFFKENLPFYFLLSFLIISAINFFYFFVIKRKRYFLIERNSIILLILYWINLLILHPFDKQKTYLDGLEILFMCLCVVYVYYTINQMRKFLNLRIN